MLYLLAERFTEQISLLNLFTYVTSRTVFGALTGMLIGLLVYPSFIRWQREAEFGEQVRDDGPETHHGKAGTPTMGGIVIILSCVIASLLWTDLTNPILLIVLASLVLFAGVGFIDDWRKLKHLSGKGLSAAKKFTLQTLLGLAALLAMWHFTDVGNHSGILVPYWKDLTLSLGVAGFMLLGWLCIVGASNAVNLTDGLDGLAILPAVMVATGLGILAYVAGHAEFSFYLGLPNVIGAQELVVFLATLAGAGLAFLWFNVAPAQVFMGDTGSLAIGAALATAAVAIRQELVFAIMGGLFVLEAVSVILQVGSFKLTGRRIFHMAPLHHHFEQKGWHENVVVVRFWIITIILVLIGLASLKIR